MNIILKIKKKNTLNTYFKLRHPKWDYDLAMLLR